MEAYKVTTYDSIDGHLCCCVIVADDKKKAKELFWRKYGWITEIKSMELIAKEVLVQRKEEESEDSQAWRG